MKVLLTTNCPTPYINSFADELGKLCEVTLVYERKIASNRDKSWKIKDTSNLKFKLVFLKGIKTSEESALCPGIIKIIKKNNFDRIIVANPTTPTGIIALLYCRKHKVPFIIQSEGGFQGTGKGLKEHFKKYIMEKAEFYLTGMGGDDDYFLMYGATKAKLRKYNFSSLNNNDLLSNPVRQSEKEKIKNELGIKFKNVVLYVGQFINRKDIPTLLKAYKGLDNDTCLVLLGGKKTRKYERIIKTENINNVFFIEFKNKIESFKYYKASNIFVLPTKEDTWGLVINEAMSVGLPIISTNKSIAAMQLIENNVNGYLVNKGDYKSIHNHLSYLLKNPKKCNEIAINNINKIKNYTIEKMALDIFNYLK